MIICMDSQMVCEFGESGAVMVSVLMDFMLSPDEPSTLIGNEWWFRITQSRITDRIGCWSDENRNRRNVEALVGSGFLLRTRVEGDKASYFRLNTEHPMYEHCVKFYCLVQNSGFPPHPLYQVSSNNSNSFNLLEDNNINNNTYKDQRKKKKEKEEYLVEPGVKNESGNTVKNDSIPSKMTLKERKKTKKTSVPEAYDLSLLPSLPDPIREVLDKNDFISAWSDYVNMRSDKPKPEPMVTVGTVIRAVNHLAWYKDDSGKKHPRSLEEMIHILNRSTDKTWTGLFEPDEAEKIRLRKDATQVAKKEKQYAWSR